MAAVFPRIFRAANAIVNPIASPGWSPDELETPKACPACGGQLGAGVHCTLQDLLEGVPGIWQMRRCATCGSLALDPRPTRAAMGQAYLTYYTHGQADGVSASDNGAGPWWKLANGYLNARYGSRRMPAWPAGRWLMPLAWPLRQQLDYFHRHLPAKPGRLLDVGCGNGVYLLRAQSAGWRVQGIEPDARAVAEARRKGLDVHAGTLDDFAGDPLFDVVSASHVIEHVHEPGQFLEQIAGLLRGNGMLWLATPNVDSPGHRHYGRAWRGLEPPRHVMVFSARALRCLLERTGFTDIRFRRRGRGARYIVQTSQALAQAESLQLRRLPAWRVDLGASLWVDAGEELVVTARKAG